MKKFYIYFIVSLCVICSLFVSVSAESSVEVFDPLDYAIIDYWTDNQGVTYDVSLPANWYNTGVYRSGQSGPWAYTIGGYSGSQFSFDTFIVYDEQKISFLMYPLGGYAPVGANVGFNISSGHILDLESIPKSTFFQSGFQVKIGGSDIDTSTIHTDVILLFTDENNNVIYRYALTTYQEWSSDSSGMVGHYSFSVDFSDLSIPAKAVGFYPYYTFKNLTISDVSTIQVKYSPFRMGFSMSALQLESQQNQKLQNTMDKINDSIDNAVNGTVDPQKPNNSGDFDDLKDTEDDIMDNVQNYLNDGMGFFDNAVGAIMGVANGFQAIKVLMIPVFNLPFVNGIILVSVSLGLIGTLLGIASVATSSIHRKSDAEKRNKAFKDGYKAGFTKKNDKE